MKINKHVILPIKFTICRDGKIPQPVEATEEKLTQFHIMSNGSKRYGGESVVLFDTPIQARDFVDGFMYAIMSSPGTYINIGGKLEHEL